MEKSIHKFWWLWLPLLVVALQVALEVSVPDDVLASLHSETGPHEMLQFIVAVLGLVWAIKILKLPVLMTQKFLYVWVGIAALGCLYIAGEEISWGQHVLQWSTPEYWHAFNDQGETNLHNTSSWLDQKPRLFLKLGVLFGGIVIPLFLRFRPSALNIISARFHIVFPPFQMMPIALIVLGVNIVDKLDDALSVKGINLTERPSEVEELFLFYFVLLYLVLLRKKLSS